MCAFMLMSRRVLACAGIVSVTFIFFCLKRVQISIGRMQQHLLELQNAGRSRVLTSRTSEAHAVLLSTPRNSAIRQHLPGQTGSFAFRTQGGLISEHIAIGQQIPRYHRHVALLHAGGRTRAVTHGSATRSSPSASLDDLLLRPVPEFIDELVSSDSSLAVSFSAAAKCLDRVCSYVGSKDKLNLETEITLQKDVKRTYQALKSKGVLRGFGSCMDTLFPLNRTLSYDDLEVVTGIPTSAFKPSQGLSYPELGAGAVAVLATIYGSRAVGLDPLQTGAGILAAFVADRVALRGSLLDTIARTVQPSYRMTVLKHEAGHFLVAYLLGNPVQDCLLDSWSALKDTRFNDVQGGTVFFDPELAQGMSSGLLTRTCLDRYSIVAMAGIAAEAMVNNKAEGGSSDQAALAQLLSGLDDGKTWGRSQINSQARWGISQAFLLLREHESAYNALCSSLERGGSVGEAVMSIERALPNELLAQRGFISTTSFPLSQDLEAQAEVENFARIVTWRQKWLGANNPFTMLGVDQLADLLNYWQRPAEAELLYRNVLAWREKTLGPDNGDTIQSHQDLGRVLFQQNKLTEAEPLLRTALARDQENYNWLRKPNDEETTMTRNWLDKCLKAQGKHAEAEYIYKTFDKKYGLET